MTAQPDILGNVVLSNGDLAVLAANPYQHNGYSGFDDLQVAILANSTPVTLNQTTGNISFPSGDSPNGSVSGDAGFPGDASTGGATIAALPGGGMAIMAWGDSSLNYTLQILSNSGAVVTAPFVVHSQFTTAGNNANNAANPVGAVAAWSGGFVVAYSTDNESKDYYQRYTSAGVAVGSPVLVASTSDGSGTGWRGSVAVDSSGDVIFGFGTSDIFTPGAYKMYSSANAVLNTHDSVGKDATTGATAVANQGGPAPTFVPLPGGGFATVGYTSVGTYNATAGNFPSFTMNVQTVSTAGAITTPDTVTHAVQDNYYQTANINWISVLPDGTVEFQEVTDNSYYHHANLADSYTVGGTLVRGGVTLPLPSDGNTPFSIPPATGSESNVVGVIVNSSNQLVGEGFSATTVAAPSITGISPDTGTSSTDGITDTGALTVNGTATAGTSIALFNGAAQIGSTTTGSGGTWSIVLGTALGQGSYSLTATASSGGTTSSASTGYAVTVDTTPPSVTADNRVGTSPNNASSDQFTVTFSESVVGVSTASFQLTDTGSLAGSIASVSGSGSSYTVTVSGVTGDGTMRLDLKASGNGIADTAGNVPAGYTSGQTYTIEHTPPSVTAIDTVGSSPNSASSEQFTVTFSESVVGVSTASFQLTDTGSVAGSIASVSGSGSSYTVTVSGVTGDGTMRLDLKGSGNSIEDAAGNVPAGYTSGQTYTIEHPPVIIGTVALQTTTDEVTVTPFAAVSIADPNVNQSETITITLSHGGTSTDADGTLAGAGLSKTGTGTYELTVGDTAAVTMALDALVFTPTAHQAAPGDTVTTGFTIAISDTLGQSATDTTTTIIATAVNDPPAITGTAANHAVNDDATALPFAGVTVTDPDAGASETVTITLTDGGVASDANGTLSGTGLTKTGTGTYTLTTGTPGAVTTALDAVVFTPTAHEVAPGEPITTGMTLAVTDGIVASPVTDATTSVIAIAVNDPPVIAGTTAGQTTTDESTVTPFAGVTISDVDLGQTETVTVTLSNRLDGTLSNLDGGSYNSSTGVYSITGTDAAVSSAVDGLVFTPTVHQVAPGSTVTTTFSITATDTAGASASDVNTTVAAAAANDPPSISLPAVNAGVPNETVATPFTGMTIADPDVGHVDTVTVTLSDAAGGTLSNLGGGSYNPATGVYTVTGSAIAVTGALQGLVFTPAPPASGFISTTDFTVVVTGSGGTASNSSISVTSAQQVLGLGGAPTNDDVVSASPDGSSFAAPTSGKNNEAVVTDPSNDASYILPTGYQAEFLGGSANATLTDPSGGNALLVGNSGNDTLVSGAANDTIVGGSGQTTIQFTAGATSGVAFGGAGSVMILDAGGNDTLAGASGATAATTSGSGAVFFSLAGDASVLDSGANSTLVGGSFQSTFQLTSSATGTVVFGGTGSATIADGGSNDTIAGAAGATSVTTSGSNAVFFGEAGAASVLDSGANSTLVGGSGASTFQLTASSTDAVVFGGSSSATIADAGSNNTIAGASGATSVTLAGSHAVFFGQAGNVSLLDAGSGDTIVAGSGSTAVTSAGAGAVVFGGSGSLTFVGGTSGATIAGGSGDVSVTGGSGGTTLFGGSGGAIRYTGDAGELLYAAGSGNETLDALGSSTGNQMFGGLDPSGHDLIIGGSGNDTLVAGSGSDTLIGGAASHDLFVFFSSNGGIAANDVVANFSANDTVLLSGYGVAAAADALSGATSGGGSTTITLSDNTRITFSDLSSVSSLAGHMVST
jgi:Ca2+-binding RTX toxin-like protein/plastocyanin